jgi:hypothetical protein
MLDRDPHTQSVIASFFGGVLWGTVRIFTIVFGPIPAVRRDIYRAFFEAFAALLSACIGGYYVAPALMLYVGARSDELKGVISVLVGILFWQTIPMLILYGPMIIKKWFANNTGQSVSS